MPIETPDQHPALQWRTQFSRGGRVSAWIVIEAAAWKQLQQAGELNCPAAFATPDEEFVVAYAWMRAEMAAAGVFPPGPGLTPWWVWVQRSPGHPAPYLEDLAGLTDPVVLQLELPAEELVLSCFEAWHAVLNRWYLHTSPADEAAFDAMLQAGDPAAAESLQASWRHVFDLGHLYGVPEAPETRLVQGCIWQLRLEQVSRVVTAQEMDSLESLGMAD